MWYCFLVDVIGRILGGCHASEFLKRTGRLSQDVAQFVNILPHWGVGIAMEKPDRQIREGCGGRRRTHSMPRGFDSLNAYVESISLS